MPDPITLNHTERSLIVAGLRAILAGCHLFDCATCRRVRKLIERLERDDE